MLILFDIDATLVTTSRAGAAAMGDAGRELFGDEFSEDRADYAGRLDPLIIADLLAAHGSDATPDAIDRFRLVYADNLRRRLAEPGVSRSLPGVAELLASLAQQDGMTLGLLTGNYPETGRLKLETAGIDINRFDIHVWGCDSPIQPPARDHLPPVGMRLYKKVRRADLDPAQVTIIGDTVHDVRCALVNQCRALAVATGSHKADDLRRAGAHRVVDSLADTEDLVRWLINTPAPTTR